MLPNTIAGNYEGPIYISTGVLWFGPSDESFKGIRFFYPKAKYTPEQISRVAYLSEEKTRSFLGPATKGVAGGLLFGGAGMVAGALAGGKKKTIKVGLEFDDGAKVVFETPEKDKSFQCLRMYAKKKGILEENLDF